MAFCDMASQSELKQFVTVDRSVSRTPVPVKLEELSSSPWAITVPTPELSSNSDQAKRLFCPMGDSQIVCYSNSDEIDVSKIGFADLTACCSDDEVLDLFSRCSNE